MRVVRLLIYALAALVGLYVLAAVLYAMPMIGGLVDDTMEVKFDRPDPSIVADYGNGLNTAQRQGFYHRSALPAQRIGPDAVSLAPSAGSAAKHVCGRL